MNNRKTIIITVMITLLLISSIYVWFERESILLGNKDLASLKKINFTDLKVSLLVPSDWAVFDVTKSNITIDGMEKFLIIEGNNPLSIYPSLKVYQFNKNNFEDDDFTIENFFDMDLSRIHDQHQDQSLEIITEGNTSQQILYNYSSDEMLFTNDEITISCKDQVTNIKDTIFLISICATYDQWTQLNEHYDQILQSITLWE